MEPETAIPPEVAARLQVNVMVRPSPNIAVFLKAPTLFFPVLLLKQKSRIPDQLINEITVAASVPIIEYACIGILVAIGFIMSILIGCQKLNLRMEKKKKKKTFTTKLLTHEHNRYLNCEMYSYIS